jgi:hypothetical protein
MDEQEFLHKVSAETNVNIELLKDLFHNEEIITLIKSGKSLDAIMRIRAMQPRIGMWEAKAVVQAFANELK